MANVAARSFCLRAGDAGVRQTVWSIGPDGHEYAVKDNDYTAVGYEGGALPLRMTSAASFHAPGGDPGEVIACEYRHSAEPYLKEKTWF